MCIYVKITVMKNETEEILHGKETEEIFHNVFGLLYRSHKVRISGL